MVQSDKKAYDDAAASLERATKLKPDFALAWDRLGRVELRRGHIDRAVEAGERARKIDPKSGAFAADLCRSLIEKKDTSRAVTECRAAVALDARNPLALYELGKALVANGDCADARKELARFRALPNVKPEAKAQADAIAKSCGKAELERLSSSDVAGGGGDCVPRPRPEPFCPCRNTGTQKESEPMSNDWSPRQPVVALAL